MDIGQRDIPKYDKRLLIIFNKYTMLRYNDNQNDIAIIYILLFYNNNYNNNSIKLKYLLLLNFRL